MDDSPLAAIRRYCLECSGGVRKDVETCQLTDCPLFAFREGKNANRQATGPGSRVFRRRASESPAGAPEPARNETLTQPR